MSADAVATFHVTCIHADKPQEERKKKLVIDDKTKSIYKEAALSLFDLPAESEVIIQVHDDQLDDWLDVDCSTSLPDVGKLKMIVCASW